MLWTWPTTRYGDVWGEMDRLHRQVHRLFEPVARTGSHDSFPAVNIWTGEDNALLTAEMPGVDPANIEVTVKDNTVTIRGDRAPDEPEEGASYLRRERGAGTFVRSLALPFHVDGDKVTARYRTGILRLTLPRRERDKPKRIAIAAG